MTTYDLDFYTSHHQFFISDKDPIAPLNIYNIWTKEDFEDQLSIFSPGWLSIGVGCYGPLKGKFILLNNPSVTNDFSCFDHVVEASIKIESGAIEIVACTSADAELSIYVKNGEYRVRIYSSNLDTVIGDEGDDFYTIEMWEQEYSKKEVLKRHKIV